MPIMKNPVKDIHELFLKRKLTVAAAESCTGGLLSSLLTSLSGSSSYYIMGAVTYSNRSKNELLGIPSALIERRGAVSGQVCRLMAQNIRRIADTDLGIGITGIAGPTGAAAGKPVGTAFIAVSTGRKTVCRRFRFKGNRSQIRRSAALAALKMLANAAQKL